MAAAVGEDVELRTRGRRARLALAKLLLQSPEDRRTRCERHLLLKDDPYERRETRRSRPEWRRTVPLHYREQFGVAPTQELCGLQEAILVQSISHIRYRQESVTTSILQRTHTTGR